MTHLPKVVILRDKNGPLAVEGRLLIHEHPDQPPKFYAFTLEPPDLDNQPGVSCIPPGTYKTRLAWSPHFRKMLFELEAVPGRSEILIHAGNRPRDTRGCILVGLIRADAEGEPQVRDSRQALNKIMDKLPDEFWLNIRWDRP